MTSFDRGSVYQVTAGGFRGSPSPLPARTTTKPLHALMLPRLILLCVVLVISGCSGGPLSRADTNRCWAITGLMAIDAYQTTKIQYEPDLVEVGPLARSVLGRNPSTAETYQYFTTLAISQCVITRLLPENFRPYYQGAVAIDHLVGIRNNCINGLC